MKVAVIVTACMGALLIITRIAFALSPSAQQEQHLWQRAAAAQADFERHSTMIDDRQLSAGLRGILTRLWTHVQTDLPLMAVKVVQAPEPDAVTYPNGVCYITTGMLAQLRNEDQLAMVLAHELTHYVRRHALGALSTQLESGSAENSRSDTHGDPIQYGYQAHASHLRMAAEREADQEGLRLVKAAGFDETRLIALLNDFREQPNETPVSANRRALAGDIAQKSTSRSLDTNTSYNTDPQYTALIASELIANAKASLQEGLWELAEHNLGDYLRVYPDDPRAHFLSGEVQRRQQNNDRLQMAIQSYQKAIELDQGYAPAYRQLGVVQFKMGNLTAARRHFRTYLSKTPQDKGSGYIKGYLKLCGN